MLIADDAGWQRVINVGDYCNSKQDLDTLTSDIPLKHWCLLDVQCVPPLLGGNYKALCFVWIVFSCKPHVMSCFLSINIKYCPANQE